jgi:trk system potassium uptake protein TrkH
MVFPFLMDYADGHINAEAFGMTGAFTVFVGGALCIGNRGFSKRLSIRNAFLLTVSSWLVVCFFAALPLIFSDLDLSLTDAVFEAVSGVTTTGATILSGLDQISRGIILWRAIMQWIGGIGIIAFAMILLPFLQIGGMQLFRSESSDQSEKIMPKTFDVVLSIVLVYIVLTAGCTLAYFALGMGKFEALIHALTTVPTGGFSSHDASFGYYDSYALHMAAAIFMVLGGVPFILYVKYVYQGRFDFLKDEQVRTYAIILALVTAMLSVYLWNSDTYGAADAFRYAFFHVASIITTTGYATTDYNLWGPFATALFLFITYIGACAGSTAGGIKMLRINIAFQALNRHFKKLIYPSGIFSARYERRALADDVIHGVMGFLFLYVFFNVMLTVALAFTGLDFVSAITGAATAIANVGPGLGETIGPAGNFAALNDTAKWLLCFGMILGRLEVMTVLVLITPSFWNE